MSNDRSMAGRKALITGGASGLGYAIAVALRKCGADVAVADVDRAALVRAAAGGLTAIEMDVTKPASVETGVDDAVRQLGSLNVLVNSAGVIRFTLMREMPEDEWDRILDINLKGVFLTCRAAAPHLCASGGNGRIVNISSDAGKKGFPLISAYCASKFGVIGFSKAIAGELAPYGVTVNCVCPTGVTETGMGQQVLDYLQTSTGNDRDAILATRSAGVPLGRMGTPDDVANAVLFLLSDAASFITGEAINVDGGVLGTGTVPGAGAAKGAS
jgi:NAD(P)-dependent dehydrogenase (short-subunit alcohol dehydrogenase family)